jgi:isocitrate dehydrogenase
MSACVPVRWFQGVPSPVKRPQDVDMVIFRENTEDIYTGLEFEAGQRRAAKNSAKLLKDTFPKDYKKIRFPASRHQRQARVARGHGAPGAGGLKYASRTSARA